MRIDGRVVCSGNATIYGERAPPVIPRRVAGLDAVTDMATRDWFACALRRGGDVAWWNDDD